VSRPAAPTIEEFAALEARVEGLETLLADIVAQLPPGAASTAAARAVETERYRGARLDKPNRNAGRR
jgi:hypothetical protein